MISQQKVIREKPIPEYKIESVKEFVKNINSNRTVLIASCKGLPGKQFHEIKKSLRGIAELKVARSSIINRAIDQIDKGAIKNLKDQIGADIVVLFSDMDPFELSGVLAENQSDRKAKPGDVVPKDIMIEPGPTELPPGPAISELGSVGLKVSVKDGKLEIMKGAIIARAGDEVTSNVSSVLGKLEISPIRVGFIPLAAYDSKDDRMYVDIVIDKPGVLVALREMLGKALGFATKIEYISKETIGFLISKAAAEEKALNSLINEDEGSEQEGSNNKEKTEEASDNDKAEQNGETTEQITDSKEGADNKEKEKKEESDSTDTKEETS